MKQILPLVFFLFLVLSGFSQLIVEPAIVDGKVDKGKIDLEFIISNAGSEPDSYFWDLLRTESFPREWEIQVCDCVSCYAFGTETAFCDTPCSVDPGEQFVFKVSIRPNGVLAVGILEFRLYEVCQDDSSIMVNTTLTYNISETSSTISIDKSDSYIYPNPALNYFQLSGDEEVECIEILDMTGSVISLDSHKSGQRHYVTDLDKGIYLVRMMDKTNEVVKVARLITD